MAYLLKIVGIPLDFIGKPFTDSEIKNKHRKDVAINVLNIINPCLSSGQHPPYVYT